MFVSLKRHRETQDMLSSTLNKLLTVRKQRADLITEVQSLRDELATCQKLNRVLKEDLGMVQSANAVLQRDAAGEVEAKRKLHHKVIGLEDQLSMLRDGINDLAEL